MSVQLVQERLAAKQSASWQDEELALKEIMQEIALAALGRTDFFRHAIFQGGTALRILYSLERFSEDLDFALQQPDPQFTLDDYVVPLAGIFADYGLTMQIEPRSRAGDTVQKLFLKEDSAGRLFVLRYQRRDGHSKTIRVTLELDTNPPAGSGSETRYLDFPYAVAIRVQDMPSLFARKNHAALCREYTKGRDWYDFLWYVARKTPINFALLGNACRQQGPWRGEDFVCDKKWYLQMLEEKMHATNWDEARNDVERFVRPAERPSLALWSQDFFLDRLNKLRGYL